CCSTVAAGACRTSSRAPSSSTRTSRTSRRANRNRHPADGAEPVLVVGQLNVPDPGGSPAVPTARNRVDRPPSDRAEEGGVVGHPEPDAAAGHHADVRSQRGERFGDGCVDTAVHEPERLSDVLHDGNVSTNELLACFVDLEPVVTVERGRLHLPHLPAKWEA